MDRPFRAARKALPILVAVVCISAAPEVLPAGEQEAAPAPVIECRTADPTRDKPQSKLWYWDGSWWVWLPHGRGGGRIWRRTGEGSWQSQEHLEPFLARLPGRADVTVSQGRVFAVLLSGDSLAVAGLRWDGARGRYEPGAKHQLWREDYAPETATIARQAGGTLWVCWPAESTGGRMVVARSVSSDLASMGEKVILCGMTGPDDICAATAIDGGGVGVMWSDQRKEALYFRRHLPGNPDSDWTAPELVDSGGLTADDHINFCVPPTAQGRPLLVAATKTSLDSVGEPLLNLRVNRRGRVWASVPFARLTRRGHPSRPFVLWYGNRPLVAYTVYAQPGSGLAGDYVAVRRFRADALAPAGPESMLIRPVPGLNNVTGAKKYPQDAPPLLLASDREGNVYEAVVSAEGGQ